MRHIAIFFLLLVLLLPATLPAQYRRGPVAATATSGPYGGLPVTFNGTVKALTKKDLLMDLDRPDPDAAPESLTFRLSRKTKFLKGDQPVKPSEIAAGTHITLEATRDGDQKFTAMNVMIALPGNLGEKAEPRP